MHFIPLLTTFLDRTSRLRDVNVIINVHYTRAISQTLTDLLQGIELPSHMYLVPGRPRIEVMINELAEHTKGLATSSDELSGLVVGYCGPSSLRDSVEAAQMSLSKKMRDSVGGVEVVNECVEMIPCLSGCS